VLFFIAHSPVFVYHYQNKYGFEKGEEPVKQMLEIRWHGRGGQGAKTASQLLAEAAMESGSYIQAFPEYGPERAGAPIRAYTRISDDPVNIHSGVTNPDIVVVIDDSLLQSADVSEGLAGGILLVNTSMSPEEIRRITGYRDGEVATVDATGISLDTLKAPRPNLPMLGALLKVRPVVPLDLLEKKVREKFIKKIGEEKTTANIEGIQRAYKEVKRQ
jgi:pyruvate ferredoxin oxidoreductase gamma subunit